MNALFLIVAIGSHRVAFRASDVQSVVDLDTLTPAPSTPPYVAGLAALRSRPMTVIDCALSLELEGKGTTLGKAVVVEKDGFLFALSVDQVEDVVSADDHVEPVPSEMEAGWQRVAAGMVSIDDAMLLLADVNALIDGPLRQAA